MNRNALIAYVSRVVGQPFEWGKLDCTLFPAFCLGALLDDDSALSHVGRWHDFRSAAKYSELHGLTLERWLRDRGCVDVAEGYMQEGDFLLVETLPVGGKPWINAGVFVGGRVAVCTENGVGLFDRCDVEYYAVIGVRQCRR